MKSRIRLTVITLGCFLIGAGMIVSYFAGLPSFEKLGTVSGPVQFHRERYTSDTSLVLMIQGSPECYVYPDWFPSADLLTTQVREWSKARIWVDHANNWVWQLEQDGKLVVSYSAVRRAVEIRRQPLLTWGVVICALSLVPALRLSQLLAAAMRQVRTHSRVPSDPGALA